MTKKIFIAVIFLALVLTFAVSDASAKPNEFDAVCNHLKSKYRAKKVNIPFMWLARFAVGVVRPAGVKNFKVTIFRDLQFSSETMLNDEMKFMMRDSFDENWTPILRIRNQNGEQVFMNMREDGKNVKVLVVSLNKSDAVVVRAKFNPDKLAEFINNPSIFGFSIDGGNKDASQPEIETKESADKKLLTENEKTDGN